MNQASIKFCQFSPDVIDGFLDTWRSQIAALEASLDAKQEEDEYFDDSDRKLAIAEWITDHFPTADFETSWWDTPGVAELTGEWFFNGAGDISPDTDDMNTWVGVISSVELSGLLIVLAKAYAKVLESGTDHTGFKSAAPALIKFLAETMDAGDCIFYCHECSN